MEIDTEAIRGSISADERARAGSQTILALCDEVDRLRAALSEFVADYDSACGWPASIDRLRAVVDGRDGGPESPVRS